MFFADKTPFPTKTAVKSRPHHLCSLVANVFMLFRSVRRSLTWISSTLQPFPSPTTTHLSLPARRVAFVEP
jgi:hypothetical protein